LGSALIQKELALLALLSFRMNIFKPFDVCTKLLLYM